MWGLSRRWPLRQSRVKTPARQKPNQTRQSNMQRLITLLAAVLLASCATKYDALRNYSGTDAGTVVASVGMTSENMMNFSTIEFRRKNSGDLGRLDFSPKAAKMFGGTSIDFKTSVGSAALVQKRLPPGDYEIIRYSSGSNYGTSMLFYLAPENFVIPFKVTAGETTYLGQYMVGLNMVNKRPVSSYLEITDEFQRDVAKLGGSTRNVKNEAAEIVKVAPSGKRRLN